MRIIFQVAKDKTIQNLIVNVKIPEFKDIVSHDGFIFKAKDQVMQYLDNCDKTKLMLKYDIYMILDYKICPKFKNKSFLEYIKQYTSDEYTVINVLATYMQMKDSLNNLSNEKKLSIVMDSLNSTFKAIYNNNQEILNMFKSKKLLKDT